MDVPPDLVIAGAMRCGTTALYEALRRDPRVFMTVPKEPSYFATLHGARDYRGPGDAWFADQNVADLSDYLALFDGARSGQLRGEASVMYLAVPGVERSVVEHRPDVRVIVVLRDPVRRAHSAYWYLRSRGREPLGTFEEGLDAEAGRVEAGFGPMWHYVGASRYGEQIARWQDVVPGRNLLVLLTEDLVEDPDRVLAEVGAFLGLEPPGIAPVPRGINRAGAPIADGATRLLYPPDRLRRLLRRGAPDWVADLVRRLRRRSVGETPPLARSTAARLWDELETDVLAVENLLGRRLDRWRAHERTSS